MKKIRWLSVILIMIFLSGCTQSTLNPDHVIEESAGKNYNTAGDYILYQITTSSGEKQDAAVIATIETDNSNKKIESEARNAARPADRDIYDSFVKEHSQNGEMTWVKSLVRIFPWNGSDFSKGDALLYCFAGVEISSEHIFSATKFEFGSQMKNLSQFSSYIFDSGDALMSASMFTLKNESGVSYYEGVVYSVMSVSPQNFTFAFTSKRFDVLDSGVPEFFPSEGYLCWKTL